MKPNESSPLLSVQVERVIRAIPEVVFDAWVNPAVRRRWWKNVRGEGPTVCDIDARVGGKYTLKQIGSGSESADPNDTYEWVMTGEFLEFDRPRRLVFTWNVNNPGVPVEDQRVTVTFDPVPEGTRVLIRHERIISRDIRDGTDAGWTKLMEILDETLESTAIDMR